MMFTITFVSIHSSKLGSKEEGISTARMRPVLCCVCVCFYFNCSRYHSYPLTGLRAWLACCYSFDSYDQNKTNAQQFPSKQLFLGVASAARPATRKKKDETMSDPSVPLQSIHHHPQQSQQMTFLNPTRSVPSRSDVRRPFLILYFTTAFHIIGLKLHGGRGLHRYSRHFKNVKRVTGSFERKSNFLSLGNLVKHNKIVPSYFSFVLLLLLCASAVASYECNRISSNTDAKRKTASVCFFLLRSASGFLIELRH